MGRPQRHTPKCKECGGIFPHHLTVCIPIRNNKGRIIKKIHVCLACKLNKQYGR